MLLLMIDLFHVFPVIISAVHLRPSTHFIHLVASQTYFNIVTTCSNLRTTKNDFLKPVGRILMISNK